MPERFHDFVKYIPSQTRLDASFMDERKIAHLKDLFGAEVIVPLEIDANVPGGVRDHLIRMVTEIARTLKFTNQGFEKEQ
jgi:hypothetical protein